MPVHSRSVRTSFVAFAIVVIAVVPAIAADDPSPEDLRTVVETRRAEGDLDGALAAALRWRAALRAETDAAPWRLVDAERTVEHLDWLIAADPAVRSDLAEAESLTPELLALYGQGDFTGAADLASRQLDLRRRHLAADHELVSESLRRLGVLDLQQGRYGEAAARTREALAMLRRILPADHPMIARSLHNMATVERLRGDYAAAEPLYREALAMRRRLLPDDHMDIVSSLHNLAIFLSVKGDHDESEALFEEVLAHQRERLEPGAPELALTMHNLGNVRLESGRPAEAVRTLHEAVDLMHAAFGPDSQYAAGALHSLGTALRELGRVARADSMLAVAERTYRTALGDDHPHVAEILADRGLALWMGGDLEAAADLLSQACSVHERARLNVGSGYERTDFAVSPYGALSAALLLLGREDEAWVAAERDLGRTLADLLHAAATGDPDGSALPLPLEEVQVSLDAGSALVGWLDVELRTTPAAWVYVVKRDGPVRWARIPEGAVERARRDADEFRAALDRAGSWPFRVLDTGRIDDAARRIHDDWLSPVADALIDVEHLVVLPSGSLLGIPVEALRDGDGVLLDDRYAVSYAPSASLHARLGASSSPPATGADRALLVGDPAVDDHRLVSLPGARDEVRELAAVFPDAAILLGGEASETALTDLVDAGELARTRWIHLATHALADADNPDRSALVLASGDGDDGLLTAGEIVRDWKLRADLVTLSGCRTALGRESRGEGYIGLAHAFLRAGARNLVVSLWTVDDEATRLLMGRFYRSLLEGDANPAGALREARRWLRTYHDDDGSQPYAHPAYWSGFVLTGSGK